MYARLQENSGKPNNTVGNYVKPYKIYNPIGDTIIALGGTENEYVLFDVMTTAAMGPLSAYTNYYSAGVAILQSAGNKQVEDTIYVRNINDRLVATGSNGTVVAQKTSTGNIQVYGRFDGHFVGKTIPGRPLLGVGNMSTPEIYSGIQPKMINVTNSYVEPKAVVYNSSAIPYTDTAEKAILQISSTLSTGPKLNNQKMEVTKPISSNNLLAEYGIEKNLPVVYTPRVTALSTTNYFKVPSLVQGNIKSKLERQLGELGIPTERRNLGISKIDGTTKIGLKIDEAMNNNLGRTFKTFDNFDEITGTATSVKSINLSAKSYQDGFKLSSKIQKDINATLDFNNYELNGIKLNSFNINKKVINIVVDDKPLNQSQIENLKQTIDYSKLNGVELKVTINGGK